MRNEVFFNLMIRISTGVVYFSGYSFCQQITVLILACCEITILFRVWAVGGGVGGWGWRGGGLITKFYENTSYSSY